MATLLPPVMSLVSNMHGTKVTPSLWRMPKLPVLNFIYTRSTTQAFYIMLYDDVGVISKLWYIYI